MSYRTLIDAASLQTHLGDPGWVLLDCRFDLMQPNAGREAYQQGHLPGARYADLNQDLSDPVTGHSGRHPLPDPQRLANQLGAWGITPESQVLVYDDMAGAMAARAWWLLRWLGHERVVLLDGGLPAWLEAGGEITPSLPEPDDCGPYPVTLQPWVVDTEAVVVNLEQQGFTLIDARTAERFDGEQEPIDPVAGHIPGALNRPLPDNLTDHGTFKTAEQLRQEWHGLLEGRSAEDCVAMCGSGVTACHLLLSLELAGLTGARLYAGSWSEWIVDPGRPVAINR